jgi:uncharacterized protein
MCKGQCPGTAIDGDWRNRTEYCEVWKRLFEYIEDDLRKNGYIPISMNKDRRDYMEKSFIDNWINGRNINMEGLCRMA